MEGDSRDSALLMLSAISIHSLRMEGDGNSQTFGEWLEDFNPLPPHGGRQLEYARPAVEENFNPLPPHGGRPIGKAVGDDVPDISIHSLRMEGDIRICDTLQILCISIHSLRMEGDFFFSFSPYL